VLYSRRTKHETESAVRGWLSSMIGTLEPAAPNKKAGQSNRAA